MGKNNSTPLHERAHFRRIREIITEIADYEGIPLNQYDLFNIRAYETMGANLIGSNVSYNTETNRAIFVEDNKYDVFEIPKKSNEKFSYYGDFLFFIHNTSFDYYMLGTMKVTLNKSETLANRFPSEKAQYRNFGKYIITFEPSRNNVSKVQHGHKFDPGFEVGSISHLYDSYNTRKHVYKTSNHKVLRELGLDITSTKKITDSNKVAVYKNKRRSGKNRK